MKHLVAFQLKRDMGRVSGIEEDYSHFIGDSCLVIDKLTDS